MWTCHRPSPRSAGVLPLAVSTNRFAADLPLDYPSTMLLRLAQAIPAAVSLSPPDVRTACRWRVAHAGTAEFRLRATGHAVRALAMDKAYAGRLLLLGARSLVTVEADPAHGRRLIVAITRRPRAGALHPAAGRAQTLGAVAAGAGSAGARRAVRIAEEAAGRAGRYHAPARQPRDRAARPATLDPPVRGTAGSAHAHGGEIMTCPVGS